MVLGKSTLKKMAAQMGTRAARAMEKSSTGSRCLSKGRYCAAERTSAQSSRPAR
jgi:hypothetical protein